MMAQQNHLFDIVMKPESLVCVGERLGFERGRGDKMLTFVRLNVMGIWGLESGFWERERDQRNRESFPLLSILFWDFFLVWNFIAKMTKGPLDLALLTWRFLVQSQARCKQRIWILLLGPPSRPCFTRRLFQIISGFRSWQNSNSLIKVVGLDRTAVRDQVHPSI